MIKSVLHFLKVAVTLVKLDGVNLAEAVRGNILIYAERFRRPLNILPYGLPRAMSCLPSPRKSPDLARLLQYRVAQLLGQADKPPLFGLLLRHPKARFYLLRFQVKHVADAQAGV